ncbi:MAG: GAP family protein [Nanoarchaeota archaeon]|nr:GAP family protein [Nanoarchaeota archaeon]
MAIALGLPKVATVVATAVVDSVNPCAIGVLILLLSTLLVAKKKGKVLKIGLLYILAVFVTYFLFGLGLTTFLSSIPLIVAEYISIAVGLIVVLAGLIEIKDFFWYGQGFSLMIPHKYVAKIQEKMKNISVGTCIFLGVFVAAVELPCTGGPYLAITIMLSQQFDFTGLLLLILYNIIFVLPLIIILMMVVLGTKLQHIQDWKQSNKAYMRLFTGFLLIGLGWMLMLIANGTINLN